MKITLGCDPEMFLISQDGKLKSSVGLIGGSKFAPMPLTDLGEGYFVQEDNVAVEFNIPPAQARQDFVESITKTLNFLTENVGRAYGLSMANIASASFPEEELQTPASQEFGCDLDYNAWTGRKNARPKATDGNLRSCGGHIHVGIDKSKLSILEGVRKMDLFLGVPSLFMDKDEKRRALYGKAGAHRDKPFGFEYRTLSNFWIFNPKLIEWAWNNTERAISAAEEQLAVSDEDNALIVEAINTNNKQMAEHLIKKFNLEVLSV